MADALRISRPNARFQQWEALQWSRSKRQRAREFLVQGVRPITLAVEHGWPVRTLIHDAERTPSRWAAELLDSVGAERIAMAPELLGRLSGKELDAVELLAVVELPPDDLSRVPAGRSFLGLAFDRPSAPGNLGTMVRSLDALGGSALLVTGHGADPYDPKAVRASTGSLFAVPTVRLPSHHDVLSWVRQRREAGSPIAVVGMDEGGTADIADVDLTGPVLLAIGNETTGLSAGWREACDILARIPMSGSASSLNAASAATVALYEAARQRRGA